MTAAVGHYRAFLLGIGKGVCFLMDDGKRCGRIRRRRKSKRRSVTRVDGSHGDGVAVRK